jgi:hypothetical protein
MSCLLLIVAGGISSNITTGSLGVRIVIGIIKHIAHPALIKIKIKAQRVQQRWWAAQSYFHIRFQDPNSEVIKKTFLKGYSM